MKNVVVVGATSAIAGEVARAYAAEGASLFLIGRSADRLAAVADDLRVRGARSAETYVLDARELERHEDAIQAAIASLGALDAVLIAHGTLPDQERCEHDVPATLEALAVNCMSAIALLTVLANHFEARRSGCIAVVTSVAGDRGRQSNYVYGTAKGALNVFLQGLRNRLHPHGVTVLTVKPGFVDTPMTAAIPKNALFADPARVGRRIHRAMERGEQVLYVPWFWAPIMSVIRGLPEAVFKRLKL